MKANVLFFDAKPAQEKPWTEKLWVYDYRTNMHFTLKTNPLKRSDLDEFVDVLQPREPPRAQADLERDQPRGPLALLHLRGTCKRDKVNLDIFWLKDKSLEDADSLPDPDVLAQEIADDLQTALELFGAIANELKD